MDSKVYKSFSRLDYILLICLVLLAIIPRLYNINAPVTDWHSWRQVDTASVAKNFVEHGFNILKPTYHDYSNIQSGLYNPKGYRFVEFPLYNALVAGGDMLLPFLGIDISGRIVTILFSLLLLISIYYLLQKEAGSLAATVGAAFIAFSPYTIYYSRVILPDMPAIASMFAAIALLYHWHLQKEQKISSLLLLALSCLCGISALLIKPTTLFFLLPMLYLFYKKYEQTIVKQVRMYGYFFLLLVPLVAWRLWIRQFPEGVPYATWLLSSVNTSSGLQDILFRPSFFRWVFLERISGLILGSYYLIFACLGILRKYSQGAFILTCVISSLTYIFVFQGGNVQHDYYQIILIPTIALLVGGGVSFLFSQKKVFFHPALSTIVVLSLTILSVYFSFYQIQNYYTVDRQLLKTATIIDTLTSPDSLIATDTTGDTTLLYASHRNGFPGLTDEPAVMAEKGISYIVTYSKPYAAIHEKKYPLVFSNDNLYILKIK